MSPILKYLFNFKHRIQDELLTKLSKKDIEFLLKNLSAKESVFEIEKTIEILVRLDNSKAKAQLLIILANTQEDSTLRSNVATQLARMQDEKLEGIYINVLNEDNLSLILKLKVIKSLGKVGTKKSYESLAKMTQEALVQSAAILSCLLISCREKISNSLIDNLRYEKKKDIDNSHLKEIILNTNIKEVNFENNDLYGIVPLQESFHYVCGNGHYALLFDNEIEKDTKGLSLCGIIGLKSLYDDLYSSNYLIFKNLSDIKDAVNIFIFRTDGQLRFVGEIRNRNFKISSIDGLPNKEINIEGFIENGKIQFSQFSSSNVISSKLIPKALQITI